MARVRTRIWHEAGASYDCGCAPGVAKCRTEAFTDRRRASDVDIANVTVIGAGNMGSGIAQSFAAAGYRVTLHDVSPEAIARGIERIRKPLEKRVSEGKMPHAQVNNLMAHLHAEADFAKAVRDADLVVEAIFEDLDIKKALFARLDGACPPKTILATNTSSLLVADLASATKRPANVIGLHYFFPAAINKLVEVVATPASRAEAVAACEHAVRRAGKIPIRTGDAPGFCVNRFFVPWINEACRLLDEGIADIPTIEHAAKQAFGISMGPFELMNVTGVPISLHAQRSLHARLGNFYEPAKSLDAQVAKKENWDLSGTHDAQKVPLIAQRLQGVVFGIACHLVEEGIATPLDTDRGATIGLRWKEGPFAMMNRIGLSQALACTDPITKKWGKEFRQDKALAERASKNQPWHLPAVAVEWLDAHRIAHITFRRPEALNALSPSVLNDLAEALDQLESQPPRVLVVTGEGKAFIAGADIPTMRDLDVAGARAYTEQGHAVLRRFEDADYVVIMALNGFTFGGGLELALAGDILLAAEDAQLGLPEVGLGIHPGFGGTQRLARRIGPGKAKLVTFTGMTLGAREALAQGIVDQVHPATNLADAALALARTIAAKAPLAVAGAKKCIDAATRQTGDLGLQQERESVTLLFATKDKTEGLAAFMERRTPTFTGT